MTVIPTTESDERLEAGRLLELGREVRDLRDHVATEGGAPSRTGGRNPSPIIRRQRLNFAHYLALRHRDIRPLQRTLMRYGLSSLGRLEGRVLATLDAVEAALQRMAARGVEPPALFPAEQQFFRGERLLHENAVELFGPCSNGQEVRILVTLSAEAAESPGYLLDLASEAWMRCASIAPMTTRRFGRR
jgi:pyruvate kinase